MKLFLILAALGILWLPSRTFEQFASWQARLRTARDNELAGPKGGAR